MKKKIEILRKRNKALAVEITLLRKQLNVYKKDWALKLHNDLENMMLVYSDLLSPAPVNIPTTYQNQSYVYNIDVKNVVGVFSERGYKKIMLLKPIPSLIKASEKIRALTYRGNIRSLIELLDKPGFRFSSVRRGLFLNVEYYYLVNAEARLIDTTNSTLVNSIEFSSKKIFTEFKNRKAVFERISSLQKNELRNILQMFQAKS